ncbi:MAG: hypothetical protein JSR73_19315 [Proteobacteria bacterium]|nr:hypothetical protein [Pseudomonadota bacterium]
MTDDVFLSRVTLLKRLGYISLLGIALLIAGTTFLGESLHPNPIATFLGVAALVPGIFYLIALVLWHWKSRYRGHRSDLWGVLLVVESSGWFKIVYLFRHIIPDARGRGRYARATVADS